MGSSDDLVRERVRRERADRKETEARTALLLEQADRVGIEVRHRRFDLLIRIVSFTLIAIVAVLVLLGALSPSTSVLAAGSGFPAVTLVLFSLLGRATGALGSRTD